MNLNLTITLIISKEKKNPTDSLAVQKKNQLN